MVAPHLTGSRVVLITGATGALGPAVLRTFSAAGWSIRTLSRTQPQPSAPAASFPHVAANIEDGVAVRHAMQGVDVVLHMAALLHVFDPSESLTNDYRRVNVEGTATVVDAARESGVRRVVAVSSIAVYGPHRGRIDERTPTHPDTPYAATKLASERKVLDLTSPDGISIGCVLRLAAVYGPSVKGNYERLVRALARRRFIPVGRGENSRTLVFEDDAARAMLLAATHPAAAGRVFNVTDGQVHTVAEILVAITAALGRRPPRLAVPERLVSAGVRGVEAAFRMVRRSPPVSTSTVEKYLESVAVDGLLLRETLGFEPRWSLADGWRHTVTQLRHEGKL
jgi:nucleoside-diphosphate-sugar epimerase